MAAGSGTDRAGGGTRGLMGQKRHLGPRL